MANIENNPFLRTRLYLSDDRRFIIDNAPRQSGKTYYFNKCLEHINDFTNMNVKIISKCNNIYRHSYLNTDFIRPSYFIRPSNIIDDPNTMYFIDEFDRHITNHNELYHILYCTQAHFYITGTPLHNNSLLNMLCEYVTHNDRHENDHLEVEYIRRNPDGTIEPWDAPASYRRGIIEEPIEPEEKLFVENDEENSYLFRLGI